VFVTQDTIHQTVWRRMVHTRFVVMHLNIYKQELIISKKPIL
jgi:hypothetical protein